jgi:UDP-MurNAc hydroxylase
MLLKFYGNAYLEIKTDNGKKIVCDPWVYDGAMYGSWFHYPPVTVPPDFHENVDYIYISHLHPDHLDQRSLAHFAKDIPVIISERKNPALAAVLRSLGFKNVQAFSVGQEHQLEGFKVRLWNDFSGSDVGRRDTVGFELDSSLAVIDGGRVVLNVNDNIPEEDSARQIHRDYPRIDCALLPYAGAGSYPHVYDNLSAGEKAAARARLQERFLGNFLRISEILAPQITVPCAGEFIFAGKLWEFTEYIHTPTPTEVERAWQSSPVKDLDLVQLACGDTLQIPSGEISRAGLVDPGYSHRDRVNYAKSKANSAFLLDEFRIPADLRLTQPKLLATLNKARATLTQAQKNSELFPELSLILEIPGHGSFVTDLRDAGPFKPLEPSLPPAYLKATLSYEHLFALLTQHAHWNNVENGGHVRMFRQPEKYEPDVHMLLSFFHF